MELEGKTLILTNGINDVIYRSSRNVAAIEVLPFGDETVYDVLWANTVVIERGALDAADAAAPAEVVETETPAEEETEGGEVEAGATPDEADVEGETDVTAEADSETEADSDDEEEEKSDA
jgi:hypothetical protein